MWKHLAFSNVVKYLDQGSDGLSFKKLAKFFEGNEVETACDKELKKIHFKTFLKFKSPILIFIISITMLKLIVPVIIHQLIFALDLLINQKTSWVGAAGWSLVLIFCQILHTFVGQHYIYQVTNICQSISKKINKMIFNKVLNAPIAVTESEVINRSVQDSENASNILWIGTEFALCLLTIISSSFCLLFYLGSSAVLPLILLFTIFPVGKMYARRFSRLQTVIQKNKDDRLESLSNFLGDMNAIKSFGWEDAVFNEIKRPRRIEQAFWKKLIKLRSHSTILFLLINALVASLAFGLYVLNGGVLTAELAFACLCYFGFLEPSLKQLSKMSNDLAGALTANDRIQQFLNEKVEQSQMLTHSDIFDAQSVAIVGNLGRGKSTLLNQLVHTYGGQTVGYQPQDPYIFEASLIENLTLGKAVNKHVINKALDLTFLNTDLTFTERGLRTRLKAGGDDLSFAQKQRIVLARTFCLNPDLLLFDEPCSSFDSNRVDFIFNNLIFGEWENKKKVIVTSQMRHLPKFDRIIFIDKTRCLHVGSYQELLSNQEFFLLVQNDSENNEETLESFSPKYSLQDDETQEVEDDISENEVTPSLYLYYLKAMHAFQGKKRVALTLSLLMITALSVAFLPVLQNIYITKWTGQGGGVHWALGYLAIGFILSLLAGFQNFIWSIKTFKAAINIHDSVLTSVLGRYITFFDMHPGSKLLNVFSKDLDTIEKDLTFHLEDGFISLLHTVSSLLVLLVTLPLVIFILIPVSYFFGQAVAVYRKNLCRLKNLIAEARIPRIRSLAEVVEGRDVILAFNAQRFFMERLNRGLNYYQDTISFQTVFSRWFVIKISCLGSAVSLGVAAYACYYSSLGVIGKGVASMMILYSFKFWENICWSVKSVNEADSQMVFVKKFKELSKSITIKENREVPSSGDLVFDNVVYSSNNNKFNSIDFLNETIRLSEKVGVYSMSEISRSAFLGLIMGSKKIKSGQIMFGSIAVDDEFNRSPHISFVSDKTDLFRGSVRSNLDPLARKSDSEIEEVLNFLGLELELDLRIYRGGSNLSGGERRLMCLARALIANTPILVIEESHPCSVDLTYQLAIDKILKIPGKTVLLVSDDERNLKTCERIFRIGHRINEGEFSLAV